MTDGQMLPRYYSFSQPDSGEVPGAGPSQQMEAQGSRGNIMTKSMVEVVHEAEAFAVASQHNPEAQRQWANACPTEHRDYFCTAMDSRPRVQLQGIDELTMELADELPVLSWELRQLIRVARPLWVDEDDFARELVG